MSRKENVSPVSTGSGQNDECGAATMGKCTSNDVDIEISVHRSSSISDFVADTMKIKSIRPLKLIFRAHTWSKDEALKEKVVSKIVSDIITEFILVSHIEESKQKFRICQMYTEINRLIERIRDKEDQREKLDKKLQKHQNDFHKCLQLLADRKIENKQLAKALQNLEKTSKPSIDEAKSRLMEVVSLINQNAKEYEKYESAHRSVEEIEQKIAPRNTDINNKAQEMTDLMNNEIPAIRLRCKELQDRILIQKELAEKNLHELNNSKMALESILDSLNVNVSSSNQLLKEQTEIENQLSAKKRSLENDISVIKGKISILKEIKEGKIGDDEEMCLLNRLIEQKKDLINRLKKRKSGRKAAKKAIKNGKANSQNVSKNDSSERSESEDSAPITGSISPKVTGDFFEKIKSSESNSCTEAVEI